MIDELAEARKATPLRCSRAGECLTYRALAERANRYARWALEQSLGKGEAVVPDDAEPARIHGDLARHHQRRRGVVSLINTNLRGSALAHCIDIVAPKHIIVAAELCGEVRARACLA